METTQQGGGLPPRHVEMETTQRGGGLAPLRCVERETTRRGGVSPLLVASKWKEHDGEGYPHPSSLCQKGNNATRRGKPPPRHVEMRRTQWRGGIPLLTVSKRKRHNMEGGRTPPHRVEMGRMETTGGPATPPRHVEMGTT